MNPLALAAKAKGALALLRRAGAIVNRYGVTPARMECALALFIETLERFDCGASFPLTATVLARNRDTVLRHVGQGIEFAVHGYSHIDYARLEPEEQLAQLHRARALFAKAGIPTAGFRSPYLRRNPDLRTAVKGAGFGYVSNQPIIWDVFDDGIRALPTYSAYERAVAFYEPWLAGENASVPRLEGQLVEIPIALPDDEMLLDRLGGDIEGLPGRAWLCILSQTYRRGELFVMQLHPERIALCVEDLSGVLAEARALNPSVWIARLEEIAGWWKARMEASVKVERVEEGAWHISLAGPPGTTVLVRGLETEETTVPWRGDYQKVSLPLLGRGERAEFTIRAACQPFIGISPSSTPDLDSFLRQQGYITQIDGQGRSYAEYLDRPQFVSADEKPLLDHLEESERPLVRLGRWPDGAQSALCITGDIDALTLWDYGLRLLGR